MVVGKKPELHITKFLTIKIRKGELADIVQTQLEAELKLLVTLGQAVSGEGAPEHVSNFGIRAIDYKIEDSHLESNSRMATYLVTSDTHEASQLWIP